MQGEFGRLVWRARRAGRPQRYHRAPAEETEIAETTTHMGGTVTRARDRAVEGGNDLSRFVVHLTRDDTADSECH